MDKQYISHYCLKLVYACKDIFSGLTLIIISNYRVEEIPDYRQVVFNRSDPFIR